jgi:RecB family endonuclease NucS|tara:strand:- start:391 stop:642 length:252 start_codon:yes stop_codon:yes gene_type:complete
MPQDVKIWEVGVNDDLTEILDAKLDLEERLENWLEKDISIISNDLLVIGRQVETDFGGIIDLLCLDNTGDIVIVELKRGQNTS